MAVTEPTTQPNPSRVLSFTEHLEELRGRLIICVTFFALAFLVGLWFAPRIVAWLIKPLTNLNTAGPPGDGHATLVLRLFEDGTVRYAGVSPGPGEVPAGGGTLLTTSSLAGISHNRLHVELPFGQPPVVAGTGGKAESQLFYLSPIEPVMLLLKGALLASAVVSIPMAIYQLWLFIAPGLLRRERKIVRGLLLSSLLLFPTGALFAYFIAHVALQFLLSFGEQIPGLTANIVASKYVGFIMGLMIIFGLVFEFPLVLLLLARLGVIDSAFLMRKRRFAVLIMAVVAAVGTPSPDPFSMIAMLIPLLVLYEGSIWAIKLLERADRVSGVLRLRQDAL